MKYITLIAGIWLTTGCFAQSTDSSYCFINDIVIESDQTFLVVDYIQYYTSDKAIAEARKRGEAEYDILENGDTSFFVYNDYFIVNANPKLRTFQLKESSEVRLLDWLSDREVDFSNPEQALKSIEHSPFIITTNNGAILRLEEIYVP